MPTTTPLDDHAIQSRLRAGYLQRLGDKMEVFLALWAAVESGDARAERQIRSLAHQLAGSGAGYGFPTLTVLARGVERASRPDLGDRLAELLQTMGALRAA